MKSTGFVALFALGVGAAVSVAGAQGRGATPPPAVPQGQVQGRANQPPPPPLVATGIIVGRVIDPGTGKPVAGATVLINGGPSRTASPPAPARGTPAALPPPPPPRVLTDNEGRFAFRGLVRGNYTLNATKNGYAGGSYGRTRPDGPTRPLQLDDNERAVDIVVRIFKLAAITGRVTDEAGEPIVGVPVRGYQRRLVSGRKVLWESASAQTDDRGVYRFANLVPGEYVVCVPMTSITAPVAAMGGSTTGQIYSQTSANFSMGQSSPGSGGRQLTPDARFLVQSNHLAGGLDASGRLRGYATQYYPAGQSAASAEVLAIASGDERMGVDVTMRYVPLVTLSGMVMGAGGPAGNYNLRLVSAEAGDVSSNPESAASTSDSTGAFMFLGVPAGQYVVQTIRLPREGLSFENFQPVAPPGVVSVNTPRPAQPPDPLIFAQTPIVVGDADITGIGLTLQEGLSVRGRFEFTGSKPKPDAQRLTQIPLSLERAEGMEVDVVMDAPSQSSPDGRFQTAAHLPGRYFLRVGGSPSGFIVQSISINGVDATERPFDLTQTVTNAVITFTDLIGEISGSVRGVPPNTDPPAVVLFPADSTAWKEFGNNPMRMKSTRLGTGASTFRFGSLIAGDYFLIAIKDEFSSNWQDPAFLEVLSRTAQRFTLGPGEKKAITVELSDARPPGIGRTPALSPAANEIAEDRGHGPFVELFEQSAQVRDSRPVETVVGTGSISGVVMIDDNGTRPARNARVRISGNGLAGERVAYTDDGGRYTIPWLPPGDYQVVVTKPAFLQMYYGGRRPALGPGTAVHVNANQAVAGIDVTLPKGAVIAGTVLDALGQPAPGVRVQIMMFTRRDGDRVLTSAAAQGQATTNDRGEFRLYGLRPGSYVVSVVPATASNQDLRQVPESEMRSILAEASRNPTPASVFDTQRTIAPAGPVDIPLPTAGGRAITFSNVYYPGTTRDTEAAEIALTVGQELNGLNIQLIAVPAAKVEGRIVTPNGVTGEAVSVSLVRQLGLSTSTTSLRRTGDLFQAIGVPAGRYILNAYLEQQAPRQPPVPGAPPVPALPPTVYWSQQEIEVDGVDLLNLVVTLGPPMKISGRITFEGASKPEPRNVQVRLEPVGTPAPARNPQPVAPDATGAFTLNNVTPGKYRLTATVSGAAPPTGVPGMESGPAWSIVSSTVGGQDALILPFQLTPDREIADAAISITDRPAEVLGKLIDGQNKPVPGMTVALFPTNPALWPVTSSRASRTTRVSAEGDYRFTAVIPGEYYLAVMNDLDTNEWNDPAFKEQLAPVSIRITVGKSEKKTQNMQVAK